MDSKEEPGFKGCSALDVQHQYFLNELVRAERPPGKYYYHKSGLKAEPGTVVLFQYAGKIIASAVLKAVERFDKTEHGAYNGALHFDVNTIRVFDPVGAEIVVKIWPQVKRLGQAKWSLDPKRYAAFERELTGVERPSC
jgi:hypothetical protein